MIKLAPHLMARGNDPRRWLNCVRTVKQAFTFPELDMPPGTVIIGRPHEPEGIGFAVGDGNPKVHAQNYFYRYTLPMIREVKHLTAVESPNEMIFDWERHMAWYAEFLYEFARLARENGKAPVIGNWAVGTPTLEPWKHYALALQGIKEFGGYASRHSYGAIWSYGKDENGNEFGVPNVWYAFRHRLDQAEFNKLGYNPPVLITECGVDNLGDVIDPRANFQPWRKHYASFEDYYLDWIVPFEVLIRNDEYVVGAHLFTMGDGGSDTWTPYDVSGTDIGARLESLSSQLGDYKQFSGGGTELKNQDIINAFYAVFAEMGKANIWGIILACGLGRLHFNRNATYAGPNFARRIHWLSKQP